MADTLQQLWISYNNIEKLKGVTVLAKLKVRYMHSQHSLSFNTIAQVLYMSNNNVKEWGEFQKLGELQNLEDLVFVGK